jgi:predicted glycosyltransferase involved in capsule biosynthesis
MVGNMRVSVTCGVKDREAPLRTALASWLALEEVDEILLVDWTSKKPLDIDDFKIGDPRLVVARVEGQPYWVASKCHNLELLLATGDLVLRLDADDVLHDDFFSKHPFDQEEIPSFYYVEPLAARDDNERHLAGVVYARRADFLAVGGYNERIEVYGYEDTDLVCRMSVRTGLRKRIDLDTLHHLPHDNDSRFVNQPDAKFAELHEHYGGRSWAYVLYDKAGRASVANQCRTEDSPWTQHDRKARWNIVRRDLRSYVCEETGGESS